jgi:hypothetical protein
LACDASTHARLCTLHLHTVQSTLLAAPVCVQVSLQKGKCHRLLRDEVQQLVMSGVLEYVE